jgi:hypothetical protein
MLETEQSNMGHSIEELQAASMTVTHWAQSTGAKVFPSRVRTGGPESYWPPDQGLVAFLELARAFSIPIVYATTWPFDASDRLALLAQATDADANHSATIKEKTLQKLIETNPAVAAYSHDLEESIGTPCIFTVQWVHLNVVHSYLIEAKWYLDLCSRTEEVLLEIQDVEENWRRELETSLPIEAAKLANNPTFTSLAFVNQQRWVAENGPYDSFRLQYELVRKAREIFEREVVPKTERELVTKATELIRNGSSMAAAAAQLDLSSERLRRLIRRYGAKSSST